ncbi:MAG: hypothetical protein ACRDD1_19610 [Planctomycetia bacterium]
MRRHLQLRQAISTIRFDSRSWAIELPVASSEVQVLVCEISLLLFARTKQLAFLFGKKQGLSLALSEGGSTVSGSEDNALVALSRNALESVLCYLLAWYRDGVAEVTHVDIEVVGSESAGVDCTLVIKADQFQPFLPGDEAERILRNTQ